MKPVMHDSRDMLIQETTHSYLWQICDSLYSLSSCMLFLQLWHPTQEPAAGLLNLAFRRAARNFNSCNNLSIVYTTRLTFVIRKFQVPQKVHNFFTNWDIISFLISFFFFLTYVTLYPKFSLLLPSKFSVLNITQNNFIPLLYITTFCVQYCTSLFICPYHTYWPNIHSSHEMPKYGRYWDISFVFPQLRHITVVSATVRCLIGPYMAQSPISFLLNSFPAHRMFSSQKET